ncbi:MAG TPA: hypothetical protein DCF63_02820 [Planctomycetaceae bacterium]|nr:hypothetical protein [Planctomycetaceae bacterium]
MLDLPDGERLRLQHRTNPYMAFDVKRAQSLCPDIFLALLTRLCESRRSGYMETSQRPGLTGAGEVMQDRIGFRIARAFLCVVAFGVMIYRRMHQTPIRRSAPASTKLVETATPAEVGSVKIDSNESNPRHAVEAHRFPKHRPLIPGVHPTLERVSFSSLGARVRGNHTLSIHDLLVLIQAAT